MRNFCRLSQNPGWRPKGDYEGPIYISIYRFILATMHFCVKLRHFRSQLLDYFPYVTANPIPETHSSFYSH